MRTSTSGGASSGFGIMDTVKAAATALAVEKFVQQLEDSGILNGETIK